MKAMRPYQQMWIKAWLDPNNLKPERFIMTGELLLRALFEALILILRGGGWLE
jgi:hypothetical protein